MTVWYVVGDGTCEGVPTLFRSRVQAEYRAKELFPDELPSVRALRVQSKEVQ